jgi:hypothetical protein
MSHPEKKNEEEVFLQSADDDELNGVAGGGGKEPSEQGDSCIESHFRDIYGGSGFPNCAASVEDGSFCDTNDACYRLAVEYLGRKSCPKAWE